MKTRHQSGDPVLFHTFAIATFLFFAARALAVEGGLGRPISGMQIVPFAGLIPPEPGLAVSVGETYYTGSIGGRHPGRNSRSSRGECRRKSVIHANLLALHLADANQRMELCFGRWFSNGVASS
jgi:hypothetical protein